MTSVTFGMISTISVTRMKNSTLINDEKYLLGVTMCKVCSCNWCYNYI